MSSCYFSTGCFQTSNLKKIIALSIEHGFNLELSSALSFSSSTLENVCKAKGKVRFLVHNYFPPPATHFVLNLASSDSNIHHQSVNLCQRAIDLCSRLGAPFYSVHAGFALNLRPEDLGNPEIQKQLVAEQSVPRDTAYEIFVTSVKHLASYAAAQNVGLLVENNVATRENVADDGTIPLLMAEPSEIRRFFTDIADQSVGLLLDTGHAKVSATTCGVLPERYLEELKPFIRCLHLSDNNGLRDTNSPFTVSTWFARFLNGLASIPMVIEVYRLSMDEMYQQKELVENLTAAQHTP